jgi:hypothetical protein
VCALARDFLQEEDSTGRNLRQRASWTTLERWKMEEQDYQESSLLQVGSIEPRWSSSPGYHFRGRFSEAALTWFSLSLEHRKIREKISSPGNPAPGGNPGLKRKQTDAMLKNFYVKTIVKLKLNLIRNILDFASIQRNYLHASPTPWDYPFKPIQWKIML